MISCLYRSVVPRSRQLDKTMPLSHAGLGFSWKFFRRVGLSIEPSRMAKNQFETELLKIEYANSALDVSSIVDRLG